MEGIRSIHVSAGFTICLDPAGPSWCYTQRPHIPRCLNHLSAESERHVPFPCVCSFILTHLSEALAASTVKIAARDVIATWKVLISLGLAPILYGFYAFLATMVAIEAGVPLVWIIWTPILVMVTLPFVGYAALKFGEAGMDVLKSVVHCNTWNSTRLTLRSSGH